MPSKYTYIVPVTLTAKSNETYINKREYLVKECEPLIANTKDDLWNATKCPNDGCYCQPYKDGDIIYLQYNKTKSLNNYTHIIAQLVDNSTDEPFYISGAMVEQEGTDADDNEYLNLIINTQYLEGQCFYVRLTCYDCVPDPAVHEGCVNTQIANGVDPLQAQINCLNAECPAPVNFITEPYCLVGDCHQKTVQLVGYYPQYDCDGRYYKTFESAVTNSYTPSVRIYGTLEWYDHTTEETLVNRVRTRARGIDKFRLRTPKIPPYVARQIANILDSQTIYVDGVEYKGGTKMSKDFDEGGSWILTIDLYRECSENNFSCV